MPVLAGLAGGHHLVGGDRDRPDLLALAGVLPDLFIGQGRARDQFVLPLPERDGVGDQDQRGGAGACHRGRPDDGLPRPAWQDDDTRAAVEEALDRFMLVGAQRPAVVGAQRDGVRLPVDVAGEVLGRPAQLQQHLLEPAALGRVHHDGVAVDPLPEQRGGLLVADDLGKHGLVGGAQHQPVTGVVLQPEPAVAVHGLGDVDQQRVRHGVPGEADQRVHDLLGVVPGGPRVP